jgi:hypothetical protein
MAQKRESVMQRIQVGVVGMVVVLLFVSLANMVMDRAVENGDVAGPATEQLEKGEKVPDEPLAELGVAPVVDAGAEVKKTTKKQNGNTGKGLQGAFPPAPIEIEGEALE